MYYNQAPIDEKKNAIKTMIFCLAVCGLFIIFSSAVFFGYCRPFTKFEYYECIVFNREWFKIDTYHYKAIYYVDGIEYEAVFRMSPGGITKICFYYNVEDPNDVMSADREFLLIAMPCAAGFGVLLGLFGIGSFVKWKKKDEKEFLEWRKKRENNRP